MVVAALMDSVVEYCTKDETRAQLESKFLGPALQYVADKFSWGVRLFQAVAVLVLIQTLILLWLLMRELRRPPL
jgi:hypothetical protein